MWFKDELLCSRFKQSLVWMAILQFLLISGSLLIFKIVPWHPLSSIYDGVLCIFYWRSCIHFVILTASILAFGVLNMYYCAVVKHINATRFERICRSLSPYCLQHILSTMALGGLSVYCYDNLFYNFQDNFSFIYSWLSSTSDFEQSFIIGHGCFTGIMFSLKYFICNMYLIKFTTDPPLKMDSVIYQLPDLVKESFFCVIKAVHWYYLTFIIFGSHIKVLTLSYFGSVQWEKESTFTILLNIKLFLICIITGVMISFMWSMYLTIFNYFVSKHYRFSIKIPVKEDKNRTLSSALACKESGYLKYLAALDLRFLSEHDPKRREQIFAISHPGGHPHEWRAISEVCIYLLQDYVHRLSEYSFAAAASKSKTIVPKIPKMPFETGVSSSSSTKPVLSLSEKMFCYLREKPAISYFFDEFPNAKLMKLFASSQPFIWIIDALGYLVAVSYKEDKYGVVQKTLPEIICLLLDIKMAEEKMPVGLVGIRTYVKDPQGRYEYIHQRLALKTTVNHALCRIACTFDQNINGIDLPEEYRKYFERYLFKKN